MLKRAEISPWGHKKKLLIARGLLGTSALFCVFEAISTLPLASATVIQFTYPTFTAVAAWFLLKEGIGRRIGIAVTIGWLGVIMVVHPGWVSSTPHSLPAIAVLIALSGAILTALAYISVRELSKHEHPLVIVHYFPLISVPITLPFLIVKGFILPIGIEWIWLMGVGVFTQIGQVWITQGLSIVKVARASSINYVQILFAAIWGILFFSEELETWTILGALFILVGSLLSLTSNEK